MTSSGITKFKIAYIYLYWRILNIPVVLKLGCTMNRLISQGEVSCSHWLV